MLKSIRGSRTPMASSSGTQVSIPARASSTRASSSSGSPSMARTLEAENASGERRQQELLRMVYRERRTSVLHGTRDVRETLALQPPGEVVWPRLLTSMQRTVAAFGGYVLVATLMIFPAERWSLRDCAYWAVVTFTTVGYGDLSPTSAAGKILSMILSILGLVTVTASLNDLISIIGRERRRQRLARSLEQLDAATKDMASAQEGVLTLSSPRRTLAPGSAGWRALLPRWVVVGLRNFPWLFEATLPLLVACAAGTLLGRYIEGWGLLDSIYFSVISILTVGYGDFAPSTDAGRALCTLFLPVTCAAALRSVSALGVALLDNLYSTSALDVRDLPLTLASHLRLLQAAHALRADRGLDDQIARIGELLSRTPAAREHGLVSEADFICSTLEELGLAEADVIGKVREQFYRLDKRALGFLSIEQYEQLVSMRRGGARMRWRHAVSMVIREQRVLGAFKLAIPQMNKVRSERLSGASQAAADRIAMV